MRTFTPNGFLAISLVAAALPPSPTRAAPGEPGTRALGMGGALRAAATGDAALAMNPSGMSLARTYVIEGAYQGINRDSTHAGRVSAVDSTSASNLAGGVYYEYLTASPTGAGKQTGHEAGMALAFPFGERLSLGGMGKYVKAGTTKDVTFDVGATVRPVPILSIGVAAYNLRELHDPRYPQGFGGGASVSPITNLLLTFDGAVDFATATSGKKNPVSLMGGAEFLIGGAYAVRAGGGHDGRKDSAHASVGLSILSEAGALDLGVRRDVSGSVKDTFFGVSGRLFVPSP